MSPDELGRRVWELRGPLMRLACAIVRRQQDAEDAVSEAVVRAFESLPRSALRRGSASVADEDHCAVLLRPPATSAAGDAL